MTDLAAGALRIETVTLDAVVRFADGSTLCGRLFLPAGTTRHHGPVRAEERLNDAASFFPFLAEGDDRPTILNKREIVYVSVPGAQPETAEGDVQVPRELRRVRLQCEKSELEGSVVLEMPGPHARVLDHLNRAEQFLTLETEDRQLIVNKSWIAKVIDAQEGT